MATSATAAREHYQAGKLDEAVSEALKSVKEAPTDPGRRHLLAELLCFSGDLERADTQLDALSHQQPDVIPALALFRHLIRAEQHRRQFYSEGRVPEFVGLPSEDLKLRLEASIRLREGKTAEAAALLEQAEAGRPRVAGECDGKAFADFRDLDDLTASFFEVATANGKYFWIPFEKVELLEFKSPARPRDLLWRSAHIQVREGPDGEVYLPTVYAGTHAAGDSAAKLGRATDWTGGEGAPTRGVGLRTFLVGEEDKTILQIQKMTFKD
jgi:type VI secretion system protein ImpE